MRTFLSSSSKLTKLWMNKFEWIALDFQSLFQVFLSVSVLLHFLLRELWKMNEYSAKNWREARLWFFLNLCIFKTSRIIVRRTLTTATKKSSHLPMVNDTFILINLTQIIRAIEYGQDFFRFRRKTKGP